MSASVPLCTHVKTNGIVCGSPAVSGTALCYHHSAVKTALGKWTPPDQVAYGAFTPIPFIFPEDRASLQINYFLLFQALNEERVERRAAEVMFRMLKAMSANLGKTGTLVDQNSDQGSGSGKRQQAIGNSEQGNQESGEEAVSEEAVSKEAVSKETVSKETVSKEAVSKDAVSKEAVSGEAGAVEISAGPIAAESCFSKEPAARNIWDIRRELFRTSALHPAGQRVLNLYFKPVEREEWRTSGRKFRGF